MTPEALVVRAISSSVLILAVIGIRAAFRRSLPPAWRYALWAFVLLRLLVPLAFGSSAWSVALV